MNHRHRSMSKRRTVLIDLLRKGSDLYYMGLSFSHCVSVCVCVARFSLPVSLVSRCLSLSLTVSVSVLPVFRCLPPFSDCSRHRAVSYYSYYPTWTARILAPCYPVGCFTIRPFSNEIILKETADMK